MFVNLGLPPGAYPDEPVTGAALSEDGTTVVGSYSVSLNVARMFYWTAATGYTTPGVPPGHTHSWGVAVSHDGAIALARADSHTYLWTPASGYSPIDPSGTLGWTEELLLSADASTVAGTSSAGAFRWSAASGFTSITMPAGLGIAEMVGLTSDGRSLMGSYRYLNGGTPSGFRMDLSTGAWTEIGRIDGHTETSFRGASLDGTAMAGYSGTSYTNSTAFRWTEADGFESLGAPPGFSRSYTLGISGDGSTVFGFCVTGSNPVHAFIWTPSLGMVDLNTYLPTLGVDLTGWLLHSVDSASFDGTTLLGQGTYLGDRRPFLVTIPGPATTIMLAVAALAASRRKRFEGTACWA
jgi:probable HAF family extracellular repeat protein